MTYSHLLKAHLLMPLTLKVRISTCEFGGGGQGEGRSHQYSFHCKVNAKIIDKGREMGIGWGGAEGEASERQQGTTWLVPVKN